MRAKNLNHVLTGIFLILVALLAFYLSWPLRSWTNVGLGPGYVPKMFAIFQIGFGVLLIINGFLRTAKRWNAGASDRWC